MRRTPIPPHERVSFLAGISAITVAITILYWLQVVITSMPK